MAEFNGIVSEEEYFFDLPDCIYSPDDYKDLFDKSFKITGDSLRLEKFSSTKSNDRFVYDLIVNEKPINLSIEIMSDTINSVELVEQLNQILKAVNYKGGKKFHEFTGGVADFGIAFISEEQERKLLAEGIMY